MADDTKKSDELAVQTEMSTPPAPAVAPRGVAAVEPARARIGPEPKRLAKGQRKHLRRQKQAGEIRVPPRRS